jgi:uncharacterized protein
MIIEGIITTESVDGGMHVAPIGPHVDPELTRWQLKPFQTSTTFANLKRTGRCVFHITDHSILMASSVLGLGNAGVDPIRHAKSEPYRASIEASRRAAFHESIGWVLAECHRYVALKVDRWELDHPRATAHCSIVEQITVRPFWGWNRAKHALLELSILVSRQNMIDSETWQSEWNRQRVIVEKTAGPEEIEALALLSIALLP